jgi:hypothetical protein
MSHRTAEEWGLLWQQLLRRGGMLTPPRDLRVGDQVTVSGKGECNGLHQTFDKIMGTVTEARWVHNRFVVSVFVNDYTQLPVSFWHNPTVTFVDDALITQCTRY